MLVLESQLTMSSLARYAKEKIS